MADRTHGIRERHLGLPVVVTPAEARGARQPGATSAPTERTLVPPGAGPHVTAYGASRSLLLGRFDFERSSKDSFVQEVDRDTGLPVWVVEVVDADPEARDKTVRVNVLAQVQPVPPEAAPGVPFRPVVFEGLSVRPYVASTASGRGKLAWSFKAPRSAPWGPA